MKKMLLTSAGFQNPEIADEFLKMANKPISEIKIIFVPTASRTEEELEHVEESKKELNDIGINHKNIKLLDLNRKVHYSEVADFDVIYVCGGNTFYILQRIRETGFDKIIKQFVENGGIYVGVSAGSIIIGPNIEIAGWGPTGDENDVELKDLNGLNIVDIAVFPHYELHLKEEVEEFKKKVNYTITVLNNNQALLILNDEIKIIGK
ncbi:hypothetical protein D4Q76_00545 [archaeon]|nr:MAG: hypothetical protein D4Q76_00545 [archaeon]